MVWSAILASGTGDLVKIDGIMDKKVYYNILREARSIIWESSYWAWICFPRGQ